MKPCICGNPVEVYEKSILRTHIANDNYFFEEIIQINCSNPLCRNLKYGAIKPKGLNL